MKQYMQLTERQEKILQRIVKEYIESAQPVSSRLLERKGEFDIAPATIRIDMQKLTEEGYLLQPHTSAGRVPTDKGYRFFVDDLLKEEITEPETNSFFEELDILEERMKSSFQFIESLTKKLATLTSSLTIGYLPEKEFAVKEGWKEVLREPEFENSRSIFKFAEMIEICEENLRESFTDFPQFTVYIGKENPLPKARDFSLIFAKCSFPGQEQGGIMITGPKRMTYPKNINLLKSLTKFLNESE